MSPKWRPPGEFFRYLTRFLQAESVARASPSALALLKGRIDEQVMRASILCSRMPMVWAHGDPSLSNILITSGHSVKFVDRHRAFDWAFVDLGLVVFVATFAAQSRTMRGAGDYAWQFLREYGAEWWKADQIEAARILWASIALYLSSPECAGIAEEWDFGYDVACALTSDPVPTSVRKLVSAMF